MLTARFHICLVLFVFAAATGRADDKWIGQTVIVKSPGAEFYRAASKEDAKLHLPFLNISVRHFGERVGELRRLYYKVLAETPNDVKVEQDRVSGWADKDNFVRLADAVEYFTDEIRNSPTADIYCRRAFAWKLTGQLDKAVADFTEAIRIDPNSVVAIGNRGAVFAIKTDYVRAIADYTEVLRLDPKDAQTLVNRGYAQRAMFDDKLAIADFTQAIRIDPANGGGLFCPRPHVFQQVRCGPCHRRLQ